MTRSFCVALMLMMSPVLRTEGKSEWSEIRSLPDAQGFAGMFAGVSHGALIVAGGANIVGDKWADDFEKKWYDRIFVLDQPAGHWQEVGLLPHPLGYGVSVTSDEGVILVGGSDHREHHASVYLLRWINGKTQITPLPSLPRPCANMCGALVGDAVYVAGGTETPTSMQAMKTFWRLDLRAPNARWEELPSWPGPERMLAVAGSLDGAFYLFSGVRLYAKAGGKVTREYLRDGYRYEAQKGWTKLADLPRAAAAAPSPALIDTQGRLLIPTGDAGTHVGFQPVQKHPGFARDLLAYTPSSDSWASMGEVPFSRATAPTALWLDSFIIPSGEVRPRERTPAVWRMKNP